MASEASQRRYSEQLELIQQEFEGEARTYEDEQEELRGSADDTQERLRQGMPQRKVT